MLFDTQYRHSEYSYADVKYQYLKVYYYDSRQTVAVDRNGGNNFMSGNFKQSER